MKKIFLILIFLSFSNLIGAEPYLTRQQENMIKAIVTADFEGAKNGQHSLLFDNRQKLTPHLIDVAISQIYYVARTGVKHVDWNKLDINKEISTNQYQWILFAAISTSYITPKWVCEQYDEATCLHFARQDDFPEVKADAKLESELNVLAEKQLKKIGIEYKYTN